MSAHVKAHVGILYICVQRRLLYSQYLWQKHPRQSELWVATPRTQKRMHVHRSALPDLPLRRKSCREEWAMKGPLDTSIWACALDP